MASGRRGIRFRMNVGPELNDKMPRECKSLSRGVYPEPKGSLVVRPEKPRLKPRFQPTETLSSIARRLVFTTDPTIVTEFVDKSE
jgi:hypothetical protein